VLNGKTSSSQGEFGALYTRIIDMAARGQITKPNGQVYSELTLKAWKMNRARITDIIGRKSVDDITIADVREFTVYANRYNMARNYIAVHMKNWKNALGIMHKMGLSSNTIYTHKDFKPHYEQVAKMYLTEDEVKIIENFDLSDSRYLDGVRDRWLLMYYTGLRVSDARLLSMKDFDTKHITIMNKKTGKVVVIPIHPVVRDIITKWNGLPPNYAEAPINRELKTIGRLSGLNAKFTYKETRGGKSESYTKCKWELLTAHTGRRSAVSNMIKNGISHDMAGDMVGMNAKTWNVYNRLTPQDKANELSGNKFFNQ
jgi:integrase